MWTRRDGRQVERELIGLSADKVQIRRTSDGREFAVPRDVLSEADLGFLVGLESSTGAVVESAENPTPK